MDFKNKFETLVYLRKMFFAINEYEIVNYIIDKEDKIWAYLSKEQQDKHQSNEKTFYSSHGTMSLSETTLNSLSNIQLSIEQYNFCLEFISKLRMETRLNRGSSIDFIEKIIKTKHLKLIREDKLNQLL